MASRLLTCACLARGALSGATTRSFIAAASTGTAVKMASSSPPTVTHYVANMRRSASLYTKWLLLPRPKLRALGKPAETSLPERNFLASPWMAARMYTTGTSSNNTNIKNNIDGSGSAGASGSDGGGIGSSKPKKKTKQQLKEEFDEAERLLDEEFKRDMAATTKSSEKIKLLFERYGMSAAIVYFTFSTITLSSSITAVYLGVDVESKLQQVFGYFGLNASDYLSGAAGTFVVAYSLHKLFLPLRATLTVGLTPRTAKYLRRRFPDYFG